MSQSDSDSAANIGGWRTGTAKKLGKNFAQKLKLQVIDGDTFDADFNRNGRFSNPQERVRLLYVDTPELKKSHKGKDPKLGLPAKGF